MSETFISYARKDGLEFAEQLERALPNTWRDKRGIDPTNDFTNEIEQAIQACRRVVLCLTQDTLRQDSFVRREIVYAQLYKKPIVVVRFHDVIPHIQIVNNTWIDHFRLGWDATLNEIRRVMALPPLPAPAPLSTSAPIRPSARTRITPIRSDDPSKNRAQLIARVRHDWIEGILYPTLDDARQVLKIGIAPKSDAVLNHEGFSYTIDPGTTIETIFSDISERRLLILGDPGAGKTVLLLQLAEALLAQAERSPSARVPVVFNLASWAQARKPIIEWMDEELKRFYDVRHRNALSRWMKNQSLIFMFDGLDEVKEEARAACLEALNDFQAQHKPPMVVCSRVKDYESLPQKLKLKSAILLAPLSHAEVDEFLRAGSLTRLKTLAEADAVVGEMSRNPFLLNTMAYAYDDANPDLEGMSKPRDPAERREHLFEAYIRRRFAESPRKPYDLDDTLRYLRFLAKNMQTYSQTIFRPEIIDDRWLGESASHFSQQFSVDVERVVIVLLISLLSLPLWLISSFLLGASGWGVLFMLLVPILSIILPLTMLLVLRKELRDTQACLWVLLFMLLVIVLPAITPIFLGGALWQGPLLCVVHWGLVGLIFYGYYRFLHRYERELRDFLDQLQYKLLEIPKSHFSIRWTRQVPFNLQAFIDFTISLKIMRAYGGGFVFAHRYLRETLAGLDGAAGLAKRAAKNPGSLTQLIEMTEQTPEILVSLLKHEDSSVRSAAVAALGELAWQSQTQEQEIYYQIARKDTDNLVRIGAAAVDQLIGRLGDRDSDVRRMAAWTLGRLGDARAVEPLIRRLGDESEVVRFAAAKALGQLGDGRAVEPLIACLVASGRYSIELISAAAKALSQLGQLADTRVLEYLMANLTDVKLDDYGELFLTRLAYTVEELLVQIGAPAIEPLIARLGDDDSQLRARAVKVLGQLGDDRAVEAIARLLNDTSYTSLSSETISEVAQEALRAIGTPEALAALEAWRKGQGQ